MPTPIAASVAPSPSAWSRLVAKLFGRDLRPKQPLDDRGIESLGRSLLEKIRKGSESERHMLGFEALSQDPEAAAKLADWVESGAWRASESAREIARQAGEEAFERIASGDLLGKHSDFVSMDLPKQERTLLVCATEWALEHLERHGRGQHEPLLALAQSKAGLAVSSLGEAEHAVKQLGWMAQLHKDDACVRAAVEARVRVRGSRGGSAGWLRDLLDFGEPGDTDADMGLAAHVLRAQATIAINHDRWEELSQSERFGRAFAAATRARGTVLEKARDPSKRGQRAADEIMRWRSSSDWRIDRSEAQDRVLDLLAKSGRSREVLELVSTMLRFSLGEALVRLGAAPPEERAREAVESMAASASPRSRQQTVVALEALRVADARRSALALFERDCAEEAKRKSYGVVGAFDGLPEAFATICFGWAQEAWGVEAALALWPAAMGCETTRQAERRMLIESAQAGESLAAAARAESSAASAAMSDDSGQSAPKSAKRL
jgi:hypothetical protein